MPSVITSEIIITPTVNPIGLLIQLFTKEWLRAHPTNGTTVNGTLTDSIIRFTTSVLAGPPVNYNIINVGMSAIMWYVYTGVPTCNSLRTTLVFVHALIDAESRSEVSSLIEKTALTIGFSIRRTVRRVFLTALALATLRNEPVVRTNSVRPIDLVSNNV